MGIPSDGTPNTIIRPIVAMTVLAVALSAAIVVAFAMRGGLVEPLVAVESRIIGSSEPVGVPPSKSGQSAAALRAAGGVTATVIEPTPNQIASYYAYLPKAQQHEYAWSSARAALNAKYERYFQEASDEAVRNGETPLAATPPRFLQAQKELDDKYIASEPDNPLTNGFMQVMLRVANDTKAAISSVRVTIQIMAKGRSVPLADGEYVFSPPGGIEAGEVAEWAVGLRESELARLQGREDIEIVVAEVVSFE